MTPVSRTSLGTKCAGIRLQIWPRSENFPAVGLRCVLFFIPRLVAGIKPVSQLFFYPKQSTPKDASEKFCQNGWIASSPADAEVFPIAAAFRCASFGDDPKQQPTTKPTMEQLSPAKPE